MVRLLLLLLYFVVVSSDTQDWCILCTAASCDDAFLLNSLCYKVHKNENVSWFTAIKRCLSDNASLAIFDVDVRQNFPSTVLSHNAWIGLVKSWWTWSDSGPGKERIPNGHSFKILHMEGIDGEQKTASITHNEMKSREGYSKWKEVFYWISNK